MGGTTELVTAMVEFCWEAKNLTTLNETIVTLSKRRAQLKQAVTKMVQQACKYVEELSSEADKLQLIETLRSISEGKIYVEVERARLTKILADIHEAKGEVEEARKLMQDTTVETLGGMDRREKTEFILEQVRLCLAVEDYIRAHIQIKKIQPKVFADVELDDLKLRYYGMIVRYHVHSANWMEVFRAYQAMWSSPSMTNDDAAASRNLKLQVPDLLPSPPTDDRMIPDEVTFLTQVLYLLLSPYDNEQSDAMHALSREKARSRPPVACLSFHAL